MKPKITRYDLELWNRLNPPGTAVDLTLDDGSTFRTRTRTPAWELGHGAAVVSVEGKSGGWLLDRVRVRESHAA